MSRAAVELMFASDIWLEPAVLALLAEARAQESQKRRKISKPVPRRGLTDATGQARWRIPIPDSVWDELRRPDAETDATWDGQRFRSVYGVPKKIFDELVEEVRQHGELRGKEALGDGVKGPISKPLELKVAAVLEMCQSGQIFKTAERLYKISIPALDKFFHAFTRLQVLHEYDKHVYYPQSEEHINSVLTKHSLLGFPGTITQFDGVKVKWGGCPAADKFANTGKEGYPTRLFNVAGDATKMVHHVHGSHPGARNDLTTSYFDEYMQAMKDGLYGSRKFKVYQKGGGQLELSGFHSLPYFYSIAIDQI